MNAAALIEPYASKTHASECLYRDDALYYDPFAPSTSAIQGVSSSPRQLYTAESRCYAHAATRLIIGYYTAFQRQCQLQSDEATLPDAIRQAAAFVIATYLRPLYLIGRARMMRREMPRRIGDTTSTIEAFDDYYVSATFIYHAGRKCYWGSIPHLPSKHFTSSLNATGLIYKVFRAELLPHGERPSNKYAPLTAAMRAAGYY